MAPKFNITPERLATFRLPAIDVCHSIIIGSTNTGFIGAYYWETARFTFPKNSLNKIRTIGHEVGHYLHHELNPLVRKEMKKEGVGSIKFCMGEIVTELVAEYAGIIYAISQGQSFTPSKDLFYDNQIMGLSARLSDAAHYLGTKRAEKAFQEHRETLLPQIARMDITKAEESLPRILPVTLYEKRILPLVDYLRTLH